MNIDMMTLRGFAEQTIDTLLGGENLTSMHEVFEAFKPAVKSREDAIACMHACYANPFGPLRFLSVVVVSVFECARWFSVKCYLWTCNTSGDHSILPSYTTGESTPSVEKHP